MALPYFFFQSRQAHATGAELLHEAIAFSFLTKRSWFNLQEAKSELQSTLTSIIIFGYAF